MLYRMDVCRIWGPYPGGNNGKSIFALWTIRPTLLVLAPPHPPFQCWGQSLPDSTRKKNNSLNIEMGARGARGRGEVLESNRNESAAHPVSQKMVSRYFRPGMVVRYGCVYIYTLHVCIYIYICTCIYIHRGPFLPFWLK